MFNYNSLLVYMFSIYKFTKKEKPLVVHKQEEGLKMIIN